MDGDWEKIEAIEGLEIERGLRIIAGDRALYKKLLHLFYEQLLAFDQKFPEALASGDRDAQRFLAHSLKGACANLGAMEMYEKMQVLDASCKQEAERPVLEAQFAEVQSCMKLMLTQLADLFS